MKNTKKILLPLLLAVTLLFGGCGKKFDPGNYVKALLDNSYKNDSTAFVEQEVGTKEQAEELLAGLREIAPYVVVDCSSYIANDILSAVALMESDSVLRLANCDLKSVGYLSSQLPLLRELQWDEDKQYKTAANIKPMQAADRIGQVLGSVAFQLPYSAELEEQYLAGNLLDDLSMKDSRAFRKEIYRICKEVF